LKQQIYCILHLWKYLCDSDRDKFIIDDEESNGTKNTEKGQELFNTIEFYLERIV
jgi:hypothetical protein